MNKSILVAAIVLLGMASVAGAYEEHGLEDDVVIATDIMGYAAFMMCAVYLLYSIQKYAVGGAKAWNILAIAAALLILSAFGDLMENFMLADIMDTVEDICLFGAMVVFAAGLRDLAKVVE